MYRILRELGISREAIHTNAGLKNDLCLDSFDLTCLLFCLETRFNINIPDADIPQLSSVEATINYVNNKAVDYQEIDSIH